MRFRTRVDNILLLTRIVHCIERQSKDCIIQLSDKGIRLICAREVEGGVQVWSNIKKEILFKSFEIMSTAKDHQITCEVPTEPLLQALKSAASASEMSIKLAKRSNTAVLCFQMEAETRQGKRLEITHDLRIKLLRVQESNELKEPMCPPPDIHIVLPSLAKVRTVLERMARLSSHVRISASSEGNLSFEIVSDGVAAEAVWSGLSIPELPAQSSEETEASDPFSQKPYYSVTVPIRSVLKFFAGTAISATTFATICADYCLILHVHIEDDNDGGTLSIYIPAFLEGDN